MNLSENDLHSLGQQAITAAQQAGSIISKHEGINIPVETKKKAGNSLASQVVTQVDLLSQAAILEILVPTCTTFDLALLTEETPDDLKRLEKDFFWCIDPLDGTLPFIESTPGYSVSIALVARDGTPYIGVIYDPVKQTLYHAIKGAGAFRNGKRWKLQPSHLLAGQPLTFINDRSFKQHKNFSKIVDDLKMLSTTMGYKGLETILHGGAAMNACWVLENAPACYFKFPKPDNGGGSLWDYAASTCIFLEMGAIASDIYGNSLDLNRPDSTFLNHRGVLFTSNRKLAEQILFLFSKKSAK